MSNRLLVLPIKGKWFYMIMTGQKQEEYRNLSAYYHVRFKRVFGACMNAHGKLETVDGKEIDETGKKWIGLRNGYSNRSPMIYIYASLTIDIGIQEWGAVDGERYYTLRIHKVQDERPKEGEQCQHQF